MKDAPFPPNYLWFFNRSLRSELARVSTEVVEYDAPTLVHTHGLATSWFQISQQTGTKLVPCWWKRPKSVRDVHRWSVIIIRNKSGKSGHECACEPTHCVRVGLWP